MKERLFSISRRGDLVRLWLTQLDMDEIRIQFGVNQHVGELQDLRLLVRDLQIAETCHEVLRAYWLCNSEARTDMESSIEHLREYMSKEQFINIQEIDLCESLSVGQLARENSSEELAQMLISFIGGKRTG